MSEEDKVEKMKARHARTIVVVSSGAKAEPKPKEVVADADNARCNDVEQPM